MSGALELVLPMPPNIGNGSHGHWSSRHRAKVAYWEHCDRIVLVVRGIERRLGSETAVKRYAAAGGFWIPPAPPRPFLKATIASVMHLGAAMDDSNAMRRHKWVEDWLVTRGYIADDRKKCLTWTGFPEQIVKRDGNYRLALTITPAP